MKTRTLSLVAFLASIMAASVDASGQPSRTGTASAPDGGKAEFSAGRSKFTQKDYAGALPLFKAAFAASSSPNAALYLGLCHLELNQLPEAYEAMHIAELESAARMKTDPAYAPTHERAVATIRTIEPRIGRVSITLANAPAGTSVTLNGTAVPTDKLAAPIAIAPGKVSVIATPPDKPPVRREMSVAAGDSIVIPLDLTQAAGSSPVPATGATVTQGAPPLSPIRLAGLVAAGTGLVGMGVFTAFGVMANGQYASLEKACGGHCTDPKYDREIDKGRTYDAVANVALVIGIAGLVGGGTLFLLGGTDAKAPPKVSVSVGPLSLAARGTF